MKVLFNIELNKQYKDIILNRALHGKRTYKGLDPLLALAVEKHLLDKSTGTLRELVTLWVSKAEKYTAPTCYDPNYDGIRYELIHNTFGPEYIESKPRMNNDLAGTGSINDHNISRHERFITDDLIMQGSSFYNGKLGFIFEFKYSDIKDHMLKEIERTKSQRGIGKFSFNHWKNYGKLIYFNKPLIEKNKDNVSGGKFKKPKTAWLYQWLMDHGVKI